MAFDLGRPSSRHTVSQASADALRVKMYVTLKYVQHILYHCKEAVESGNGILLEVEYVNAWTLFLCR
jgi:hypothetical protein